ncbi:amino acid adenylation domain-containing protein [Bradyrhizobium ottawaense]
MPIETRSGVERQPIDAIKAIDRFALSHPERVALRYRAAELTYDALRLRSDALARTLRAQGAYDAVVGYWGERDLDWATAVVAIVKAGSTYLPLDPSLPVSRASFMIEQSRCALIVGPHQLDSLGLFFQANSKGATPFMPMEAALRQGQTSSVVPSSSDNGPAYILFTSGSTGQPKGAMIERAALNNHLAAKIDALALSRTDCIAQTASHCFDISLWQLLAGLCVGGCVAIIDDTTLRSPVTLLKAIQGNGVTVVQFVPSMLAVFVDYLQSLAAVERALSLRIISTVGEPLTPGLARAWLALYPEVPILNHYGPTECADGVTHHLVSVPPGLADSYVPIGEPISNLEVYVADGPRLCNTGEVGEICVSGVGVAAGYVNDDVRTKDAFGPNPFSSDPSFQRLYRTGDLGRVRSDGLLECLGRRDRQVKIRGHRIELGEIEARLSAHHLVRGAVVVASCAGAKLTARDITRAGGEESGSRRLFAYVSAPAELAQSELQDFLAEALPTYMLPERIIHVDDIPLTRNGKVDFGALPDPTSVRPLLPTPFAEPQTELEAKLCQIWSAVLRIRNIGVNDQFITLGGDSLRAMLILGQLQIQLGVRPDFRLVLNGTIRSLAASISARIESEPCIAPATGKLARSPLTRVQEHLWFLSQLDPSARNYVIQGGIRIRNLIDLAAFNRAWSDVIHAHQALSARFIDEDGPVQLFEAPQCALELTDASHLTPQQAEELVAELRRTELNGSFDLCQGHLFRARMIRFGPDNHLILITAHEIIIDAWSISVLLRDLRQRYADAAAFLPENRASLSTYAVWETQHATPEALANQRSYWRGQIGDNPPVLSLGTGRARPQTNSYRGTSHPVLLDSELSNQIREFAYRHRYTTSTTLLACFKLLLRMYSGQDDIIVGIPHVVRDQPGSADIVGFFLNMLPIRTAIDVEQSFTAHALRIHSLVSDAIANSAYPFGWMVRDTQLHREADRSPIFQVMFNMYSEAAEPHGPHELDLSFREYDTGYVKFDLTLYAQEQGDEIALQLAYAEDIFSSGLILRMAENLRCLIAACIEKPLAPINDLSCVSASDITMLDSLDGAAQPYTNECPLIEAFEQISTSHPNQVAYFGDFGEITFNHLRERVTAIRSQLLASGLGAGDMVAMLVDRSPDVAAVILGARALQSIVVPISPDYPRDRIEHILRDSQAKLLVHANRFDLGFDMPSICLLTLGGSCAPAQKLERDGTPPAQRIASLIYTSSSTGKAKGVLIPEAAILNRLHWMWRRFPFDSTDVIAVQKSASLVASAWEYLGGLLRGVPALILTQEQLLDPDLLLCTLARHRVTRLFASPPLLSGLIASQERHPQPTTLRLVTSSAEPMPSSLPVRWRAHFPDVALWNFYGATECASNAAVYHTLDHYGSSLVPVGRPIDNVKLYVLDAHLKRVPVGASGELCIAGRCLSAGYWQDQDRTNRCFVPNPHDHGQYSVLYRTGDIARISTSGLLQIFGRSDNQIKVRGFRIELEEVETALESHPAIAKAAVFAEGMDDQRRLSASVVPARESLSSGDLVTHLRQTLPSYMIPSAFRLVDSIPLTASGKVDRARLSSVPYREFGPSRSAEPCTREELILAGIWQDLLGAKRVGIDRSFFDIGGNSLLSVRCVTLARKAGLNLTVNQLYRTPTIRELAAAGAAVTLHNSPSADGSLRVTPAISSWNRLSGFDEHFNIGDLFFLPGVVLNITLLERALTQVMDRHEGLRLRIARIDDGLCLTIKPSVAQRLVEEIDLVGMTGLQQREAIEGISARRQHTFRFDGQTSLVHVTAFRTSERGDYYLLVLMHHFVADGIGYRLFLEALDAAYNALASGHAVRGPESIQTLSGWLKRLEHYANSEAPTELKYWESIDYDQFDLHVSDTSSGGASFSEVSARELYYARLEGRMDEANCQALWEDQAKYHFEIDRIATADLLNIAARSADCQDFDVFLAAISGSFGRVFGNYSLWIDSLISTRGRLFDDLDPSQIIGVVSEIVPLPLILARSELRADRARSIYRQRNAMPRSGIGFRAMKFLNRDPAVRSRIDRLPLPKIGLNYRAGLQRHFPRRLLTKAPSPLWIGQNVDEAAVKYLFWFRVGYRDGRLQIETRYNPTQVGYEVTRNLCTVLQQELLQTINEFGKAGDAVIHG